MAIKPVYGNKCLFKVNLNGVMTPLVCAKNFRISINSDLIETTTYGDGSFKSFDYQAVSYQINFEGLIRHPSLTDNMNTWENVVAAQTGAVDFNYEMWFEANDGELRVIFGRALVLSTELNAAKNQPAGYVTTFQGTGAFEIRTTACEATIGGAHGNRIIYVGGDTADWSITLDNISTDTSIIQYSLNDSDRITLGGFVQGTTEFEFEVELLHNQANTLTIYPQCAEGIDGTVLNIPINASGFTFFV
jgi:hypothetical protein